MPTPEEWFKESDPALEYYTHLKEESTIRNDATRGFYLKVEDEKCWD